jgi:hypothetical protein
MASRLSITIGAAIDRDLVTLGADLTSQQISMLVANYKCFMQTIYRRLGRIQAGKPLLAWTGGQQRVIIPQINTAIHYLLNEYPWFY